MIKVIPYAHHDGIPTMRDSEIRTLYDLMERDGTNSLVFFDGHINNANDFCNFMKSSENILFVAFDDDDPVAFGWLSNFKYKTAQAHFCLFSKVWGERSVEIGKALVKNALATTGLDMLIGYVPGFNPVATKFAVKCGAVKLGKLPCGSVDKNGNSYSTTIVYYTR